MGLGGFAHLSDFVREGGVLAAFGNSGTLAVDGGLVRNVRRASVGSTPGSILRAKVLRPQHPIAYGYESSTTIFRGNDPMWDVDDEDRGWAVVQFGTKEVPEPEDKEKGKESKKETGPLVLSGFAKDPDKVDGKPAILDLPVGKGRVVLYAFNPFHRYLNHADFRYAYNLILNWNDVPQ